MLVVSLVPAAASFFVAQEMELPQHVMLATYLAALLAAAAASTLGGAGLGVLL